jgi:thiol peroxidase
MIRNVTFENKPLTLVGRNLQIPRKAPNFTAVDNELREANLSSFGNRIKIFSFFLSHDTPVCDIQVREFNRRASTMTDDVVVIGISTDLPFAQKRFRETFNIRNMTLVSDYRYRSFGINYGVLIKEWNLLTRGVMIVDRINTLRYVQITNELANQPDYDETLDQLEEVIETPELSSSKGGNSECRENPPPLSSEAIQTMLPRHPGWELVGGNKLVKRYRLNSFADAKYYLDLFSVIAEEQKHHPSFLLNYGRLKVTLTTHSAEGLTENDFIMAEIIDEVVDV